jgi:hypothetical protein
LNLALRRGPGHIGDPSVARSISQNVRTALLRSSIGSLLMLLASCSRPEPEPAPLSTVPEPYCADTEVPSGQDAGSPLGSPAELLQRANQSYRRAFVWKKDLRTVHHAAEGKPATLELSLKPLGPVKRLRSEAVYPPTRDGIPRPLMGLLCPDERLEVQVQGRLKTSDGVLNESFEGALSTAPNPMVNGIATGLWVNKRLAALQGSFRITAREPRERGGDDVFFTFWFNPDGTVRGTMGGTFHHGEEASLERFFCMPDGQCD